jgi:plastocyanin
MHKLSAFALTIAVLALGLTACGGSSNSPTTSSAASAPAQTSAAATTSATPTSATTTSATSTAAAHAGGAQAIAADPSGALKYTKASLTAKAGKVTIAFTNDSQLGHNLTIQQGTAGKVLGATPTFMGGTKTLSVDLQPGTYTFYCSVPGHRMAGMVGTLTVT